MTEKTLEVVMDRHDSIEVTKGMKDTYGFSIKLHGNLKTEDDVSKLLTKMDGIIKKLRVMLPGGI